MSFVKTIWLFRENNIAEDIFVCLPPMGEELILFGCVIVLFGGMITLFAYSVLLLGIDVLLVCIGVSLFGMGVPLVTNAVVPIAEWIPLFVDSVTPFVGG